MTAPQPADYWTYVGGMDRARLLVVEDDPGIGAADYITKAFRLAGHAPQRADAITSQSG